jgi:hypothetical protein
MSHLPVVWILQYILTALHKHKQGVLFCYIVSLCYLYRGSLNHPFQYGSMLQYFRSRSIFHTCILETLHMIFTSHSMHLIWKLLSIWKALDKCKCKWGVLVLLAMSTKPSLSSPNRPLSAWIMSQNLTYNFQPCIKTCMHYHYIWTKTIACKLGHLVSMEDVMSDPPNIHFFPWNFQDIMWELVEQVGTLRFVLGSFENFTNSELDPLLQLKIWTINPNMPVLLPTSERFQCLPPTLTKVPTLHSPEHCLCTQTNSARDQLNPPPHG